MSPVQTTIRLRAQNPTADDVREFWRVMTSRYGTRIIDKNNSVDMKLVADFLDAMKIVDREAFLRRYVTTIGTRIWLPFTPGVESGGWTLWEQIVVCVHEHHHVYLDRMAGEGLEYEFAYATNSTKRAYIEMECYRCNMCMHWHFLGVALDPVQLAAKLKVGYGCNDADVAMVAKMLKLSLMSIKKGAIPGTATQFAVEYLTARWSA